jgi:hypothetical protein
VKTGEKVDEFRGDIGAIKSVFTPSFRNPKSISKKRTFQPGDAFEEIAITSGFENVKF